MNFVKRQELLRDGALYKYWLLLLLLLLLLKNAYLISPRVATLQTGERPNSKRAAHELTNVIPWWVPAYWWWQSCMDSGTDEPSSGPHQHHPASSIESSDSLQPSRAWRSWPVVFHEQARVCNAGHARRRGWDAGHAGSTEPTMQDTRGEQVTAMQATRAEGCTMPRTRGDGCKCATANTKASLAVYLAN